jgi:hypothetical protein
MWFCLSKISRLNISVFSPVLSILVYLLFSANITMLAAYYVVLHHHEYDIFISRICARYYATNAMLRNIVCHSADFSRVDEITPE